MTKHYLSLKDLKSPDKFFRALVAFTGYLKNNVKLLLTIAGTIIIATTLVVIYGSVREKRENTAFSELYDAENRIEKIEKNRTEEEIKIYKGVLDKLADTRAAVEARYRLAEAYYKSQKWDEAIEQYRFVADHSGNIFKALALMGLGYSYEMKKDYKSAIGEFTRLNEYKESVYKSVAMLGIARCHRLSGENDKALAMYDSILISYPDTDAARMAQIAKSGIKTKEGN